MSKKEKKNIKFNNENQNLKVYDRYERNARVLRIVDGDTYILQVDLGFDHWYNGSFRLARINTPEKFNVKKDSEEYTAGVAASEFALEWLKVNAKQETIQGPTGPITFFCVVIKSFDQGTGKYGRWIVEIYSPLNGLSLNSSLVEAGHAVEVDYN